ncbi:Oligosaccharyl transferase, STT3 subunit [Sesbania bispinosa]|nr:Oligosaccharyl transferase, STT3 subunit [Sesbania bispinosa]
MRSIGAKIRDEMRGNLPSDKAGQRFNYPITLFLTNHGFVEFWNWFDSNSWYPLGCIIGDTLYPGLMLTATAVYKIFQFLLFTIHIHEVCVLTTMFSPPTLQSLPMVA